MWGILIVDQVYLVIESSHWRRGLTNAANEESTSVGVGIVTAWEDISTVTRQQMDHF